jgi:acyl-CoA thioesterase I
MKNLLTRIALLFLAEAALVSYSVEIRSSPTNYLAPVAAKLEQVWPKNHLVNIVFHGHSVPAGYFKTPTVDSLPRQMCRHC